MDFAPLMRNISSFALAGGTHIRQYQKEAAEAIIDSVLHRRGLTIVVMFPRQSGKNEIQGQIEAYLLFLFSQIGGSIIKISPTWKPQSINAKQRCERILTDNEITKKFFKPSVGYQFIMGKTKISFLSGEKNSNIVGATADLLLEIDEAQSIDITKYDLEIAPMVASTNATRVFFGTAWTNKTLLARELRIAKFRESEDGIKRVFRKTADDVAMEVPAYRQFVNEQIQKLGRDHPTIKTQYFSEEIDAESSFISEEQKLLMQGNFEVDTSPVEGKIYCMMIDVAGGEEENKVGRKLETDESEKRDATAITICEIDLESLSSVKHNVTWKVQRRYNWTGLAMMEQYARIEKLVDTWKPQYVCIDGTGIGGGLAPFLRPIIGDDHLIIFVFSMASKSKMGWNWLGMVNTGRWQESITPDPLRDKFLEQLDYCQYEVMGGVGNMIRFSVPDGQKNERGEFIHDDLIMSAAMSAVIEDKVGESWILPGETLFVEAADPLLERGKW